MYSNISEDTFKHVLQAAPYIRNVGTHAHFILVHSTRKEMASITNNVHEAEPSFETTTDQRVLKFYSTKKYVVTHKVNNLMDLMRIYPNGQYFDTPTLPDNYGLNLRLSPQGIKENELGFFGIFLQCGYIKDKLDKCKATIKILDDAGEQIGDHSTITMKYTDK